MAGYTAEQRAALEIKARNLAGQLVPAESPFHIAPVPEIDPDHDLLGDLRSALTQRIERLSSQYDDADAQVQHYTARRLAYQRQLAAARQALKQLESA